MSRPLIISDCDEVLLYMVSPFRDWLDEEQGIEFHMGTNDFSQALRWQENGEVLAPEEIWRMLGKFFDTEMHRQSPIPGAIEGINALGEKADVVILTNLVDKRQQMRTEQLADHGLDARVFTNQGPKGPALQKILDEYNPTKAIFIDDLAQHHRSARETIGSITTLHLCGEPMLAPHIDCAHTSGHADARIDTWDHALPWLMGELEKEPA
ncbi:HAD family hydrolase [Qipengyuania psychrotolerans]|uniref:HAD family hydrolase n=1 Tax=Qipengyuania psychrotolerans TaxID=2867238 RepID=A0ABX8ZDZ0_9SPHN|nr:HAD family hydrolase [Qipengyuania psychrotolerans]QZD87200.1 HAD family hydrolase [Qipengyuania psychrotolerans]